MKVILKSSIIIDEHSKTRILKEFKDLIPNNVKIYSDEVYICQGELPENLKIYEEHKVSLNITAIFKNSEFVLLKISGFPFLNKNNYLILWSNVNLSNLVIENCNNSWTEVDCNLKIFGKVTEIPFKI